jgi:hypothetical protein
MSRTATPHTTQPATNQAPQMRVPQDKIAKRAYEKWCMRGQPQGTDMKDWLEAEAELKTELGKQPVGQQTRR